MAPKFTNLIDIAINEFNYILDVNLSKKMIEQVVSNIPQIPESISYKAFMESFGSNTPYIDKQKALLFVNHLENALINKDYTTQIYEIRFENYQNKTKFDWSSIKCVYEVKEKDLHAYIISRDITAEKENEIKVIRSSQRDPLSGLINRFGYSLLASQALLEATHNNTKMAFFFMDVDDFKTINDLFGHAIGDQILYEISQVLIKIFRDSDIICRYGGDEFVVVLPNLSDQNIINEIGSRICSEISKIKLPTDNVSLSCSVGISVFPNNSRDLNELVHLADIALYYAKSLGKNCYFIYDENNKAMSISNSSLKNNNKVLNQNKFVELILDETEKGILITDAESYKIIYSNQAFKDCFNIPESQKTIGKKCFELLYDYSGPCKNCNFKHQNLEFEPIIFKDKKLANKTRMIEWNDQTAYITFFNLI